MHITTKIARKAISTAKSFPTKRVYFARVVNSALMNPRSQKVLDYWLGEGWETAPAHDVRPMKMKTWFQGGPEVDKEITEMFRGDCEALLRGDLDDVASQGSRLDVLAAIIIGDQFSRNIYRGTAKMYECDDKVLPWAQHLVESGAHKSLVPVQRLWICLPFMHSEKLENQQKCLDLYKEILDECTAMEGGEQAASFADNGYKYAIAHKEVIQKWGRFPHRNAILGRESTPEEAEGLAKGEIPNF